MTTDPSRAHAHFPAPLARVLQRIGRKGSVPVSDVRAMFRDELGGDQVVEGLVSKGYAAHGAGGLVLTDAGRRALQEVS